MEPSSSSLRHFVEEVVGAKVVYSLATTAELEEMFETLSGNDDGDSSFGIAAEILRNVVALPIGIQSLLVPSFSLFLV